MRKYFVLRRKKKKCTAMINELDPWKEFPRNDAHNREGKRKKKKKKYIYLTTLFLRRIFEKS